MNVVQNPQTLIPKFFGLFCYKTMKNIRFVVMNNILPTKLEMHEKYDLKGEWVRVCVFVCLCVCVCVCACVCVCVFVCVPVQ